jgi:hypothetical protein
VGVLALTAEVAKPVVCLLVDFPKPKVFVAALGPIVVIGAETVQAAI